ncbi:hypothetical protein FRC04_010443 [Tulasnella sp. 424]|nr:hypothetical protein FRC04_010443 [Tulasnella sp. 424]KAG8978625.1 hypothetical protein FRC05_009897 [Tulasnella sp. 425]
MHVRPCLYCILLLAALFGSSCYWEPIATELLLQRNPQLVNSTIPEANVTSLVELVGQYHQNVSEAVVTSASASGPAAKYPLIPHTTVYERCWCDVAASLFLSAVAIHERLAPLPTTSESGPSSKKPKKKDWKSPSALFPPSGFFDPYDQAAWESASLVRHARQLMPPQDDVEDALDSTNTTSVGEVGQPQVEEGSEGEANPGASDKPAEVKKGFGGFMHRLSTYKPHVSGAGVRHYWQSFKSMPATVQGAWDRSSWVGQRASGGKEESLSPLPTPPIIGHDSDQASTSSTTPPSPPEPEIQLPVPFSSFWIKSWRATAAFLRQKHDLTPYGLPLIVDFGWSRHA